VGKHADTGDPRASRVKPVEAMVDRGISPRRRPVVGRKRLLAFLAKEASASRALQALIEKNRAEALDRRALFRSRLAARMGRSGKRSSHWR